MMREIAKTMKWMTTMMPMASRRRSEKTIPTPKMMMKDVKRKKGWNMVLVV